METESNFKHRLIEYASKNKLCLYFCEKYKEYFFTIKSENKEHWKLIINCSKEI